MLSGPRKEVEYVGLVGRDVGIPREEETGTQWVSQREGWPNMEPSSPGASLASASEMDCLLLAALI